MAIIILKESILNGKLIGYSSETEFLVQVGRGRKGSYKTNYRFKGDLARAVKYYVAINIGLGYKKRLIMPSASRNPVLSKQMFFGFMPKTRRQTKRTLLAQEASQ